MNRSSLISEFSQPLLEWYDQFGRHDLPWQQAINPYRVWVSEIMLQQTQVTTVIPYYQRFMQRFPQVGDLAAASQEEVLAHWAGLGYYARGRNLHKAAQQVVDKHQGQFPDDFEQILALPGIGRSTAGAILSISLQQRFPILDGNVKRVLSRYFAVQGWPGEKKVEAELWLKADQLTPDTRFADYTQAIMDLGATVCKRSKPLCAQCPVNKTCRALVEDRVAIFPYSKPKKEKPVKQAWFVLRLNDKGEILFHKRPQKGIWAGLWSFPEFDCRADADRYLQSGTTAAKSLIEWEYFRHTFSHYHLDIFPLICVEKAAANTGEKQIIKAAQEEAEYQSNEIKWVDMNALEQGVLAVPAPVNKMLSELIKREKHQ